MVGGADIGIFFPVEEGEGCEPIYTVNFNFLHSGKRMWEMTEFGREANTGR